MRTLDTSSEAERIQFDIFRRMGPDKRLESAIRLAQTSRRLLREGVRLRHPEYVEKQINLAVIRLSIGDTLFMKAFPDTGDIQA